MNELSYFVSENSRLMRLRTLGRWGLVKYLINSLSFILLSACRATSITSITLSPPRWEKKYSSAHGGSEDNFCSCWISECQIWEVFNWLLSGREVQRGQQLAAMFVCSKRLNPEGNWHQCGSMGRGYKGMQVRQSVQTTSPLSRGVSGGERAVVFVAKGRAEDLKLVGKYL